MSKIAPTKLYALAFGLFLGLCIWKFGDPVILDQKIAPPATVTDFLNDAWPAHWAGWILAPLAAWGVWLILQSGNFKPPTRWFSLLPLAWLGWQFIAATQSEDAALTRFTLWQFGGCVACYFLGSMLFARERHVNWLFVGLLAAFAFCLVRAVDQRLFEYPQNYRSLVEGQLTGWTNFPPASMTEMKEDGVVITTNGMLVANPVILKKFLEGRVSGTLVYPNALAEVILLLWPVSLAIAFGASNLLRPVLRLSAAGLTLFLGGAAFFWSGSKLGWLIGLGLAGLVVLRLDWPRKLKWAAVAAVLILGLSVFALRFHQYFAAGATSAGARLDYWRAAAQTTEAHPWFGSGPGTFQRPYFRLKSPQSEMTRLTHNDYLEQFSDSGVPGGLAYAAWILAALAFLGRRLWDPRKPQMAPAGPAHPPRRPGHPASIKAQPMGASDAKFSFPIYIGLLGWFTQGLGEFGLYVPALAWTAFTLLGCLVSQNLPEIPLPKARNTK